MKNKEKKIAREKRLEGKSIKEIAKLLGVAKSSVSLWVRDIHLNEETTIQLKQRGFTSLAIERRRNSRLANEEGKRQGLMRSAAVQISKLSDEDLRLVGSALYWGEGGKTARIARVSNADPLVIKVMMEFFRRVCEVPEEKFQGHIHIHSHLNAKKAEKYWSEISGIPLSRFYKTYVKPSKASLAKKDTLPFGTFDVYVSDVKVFLMIMGWIKGIQENILGAHLARFSFGKGVVVGTLDT